MVEALTIIVGELRRLISILPEARLTDRERMPVGATLRPHDASKTGPKWKKSDLSMYSKFRADGWPLCPACGTDHLMAQNQRTSRGQGVHKGQWGRSQYRNDLLLLPTGLRLEAPHNHPKSRAA